MKVFTLLLLLISSDCFGQSKYAELLTNFTVKIEVADTCILKKDSSSECLGSTGTGFFFRFTNASTPTVIITNKSLLRSAQLITFYFSNILDETRSPHKHFSFMINQLKIFNHPDSAVDLAAVALDPILKVLDARRIPLRYAVLNEQNIFRDDSKNHYSFFEPLYILGYPNETIPQLNYTAIALQGFASTPFYEHYDNERSFLAGISLPIGFRGGPVLTNPSVPARGKGVEINYLLVGIATEQYLTSGGKKKDMQSRHLLHRSFNNEEQLLPLNFVIKAKYILDFKYLLR